MGHAGLRAVHGRSAAVTRPSPWQGAASLRKGMFQQLCRHPPATGCLYNGTSAVPASPPRPPPPIHTTRLQQAAIQAGAYPPSPPQKKQMIMYCAGADSRSPCTALQHVTATPHDKPERETVKHTGWPVAALGRLPAAAQPCAVDCGHARGVWCRRAPWPAKQ